MKINIVTQPLYSNYGGILQNYALQTILRSLGHNPLTINAPTPKPSGKVLWKDCVKSVINCCKKIKGEYDLPFLSPFNCKMKEYELSFPQRQFVDKYINKVDVRPPFSSQTSQDYPADVWIVGSDQVWRPWCSPYLENCFLDFVGDDAAKIAFAASFGTDCWEISSEKTAILRTLVSRFDAVSVRESSGVKLCREHLSIQAEHILDPTLLLTGEQYLQLTSSDDYPKEKYIATYILDSTKDKNSLIKHFSEKSQLPLQPVGVMHKDRFDSVESWIAMIAHSEYVITDSFHGTVFSIIFNRPVKILSNDTRGNARLESLLKSLEMKKSDDGFFIPDADTKQRLKEIADKSRKFLVDSLSTVFNK